VILGIAALFGAVAPAWARTARLHASARPIEGRAGAGRGTTTSTNWSGYAAYGTTFTSVSGSWTQPEANCSGVRGRQVALAAFWVGLDGYQSNTVEQTGTEADCVGTRAVYYAWYELYPQRLFLIAHAVEPGDALSATVTQTALTLEDHTQSWSATQEYAPHSLAFNSAEWIAEGPSKVLTDFGSLGFSSASASSSTTSGAISAFEHDKVVLVDHSGRHGTVLAQPGELQSAGSAFSIDWLLQS
jgi:hypothetical protein